MIFNVILIPKGLYHLKELILVSKSFLKPIPLLQVSLMRHHC